MRISDWSSDVCSSDLHQVEEEDRDAEKGRDDAQLQLVRRRDDPDAQIGERQQCRAPDRRRQQDRRRAAVGERADQMRDDQRSEEHTSELQSLMRISYAVFCLKKKNKKETDRQKTNRT